MTYVNLITGFLGSGKTTTLLSLLAQKPQHEKWAVLVNEFGEIGIDGALLADSGAILKEIPGGCMCCVNGLPMQVGLNMLLKQHRPDRLLIEPTGLGHPKQILSLLTSETYKAWFTLNATLCVLDPRQLLDPRVRENENFRDQLAAADILIANKQDSATAESHAALHTWYQQHGEQRPLVQASWGNIEAALLDTPRVDARELPDAQHHHATKQALPETLTTLRLNPQQRWRRALNASQGYEACGWIFDDETQFNTVGMLEWMRTSPVDRAKGIVRIPEGALIINRQGADFYFETQPAPPPDSRIEMIHSSTAPWNTLQSQLLKLRLS